uniref:Transmembrane protease serine 9 n=1 Tax=Lygus hesperus TaxID=30085 RepID=A0A0A9WSV8_LYGHE
MESHNQTSSSFEGTLDSTVHAGTINLHDPSSRKWTERAKTLQVHPRCARNSSTSFTQYDFGLVIVENPFVLSPFRISIITLPDFGRIDITNMLHGNPVPCVTMGWISDEQVHRARITNLEKFDVTIQTHEWCRRSILNHTMVEGGPFVYDRTLQICAKGRNDNQEVCEMDSGGPLLCGEGPNKEFIALITDVTEERHCGKGIPLVYARMDLVDKWILGAMKLSNTYIHTSNAYVTTVLVAILTFGC